MSWLSDIGDSISGIFSSSPSSEGGFNWGNVIAATIPSIVQGYGQAQQYVSPEDKLAQDKAMAEFNSQLALSQLAQELALKKQYGMIGGGGSGGGQSTGQLINYYKQRDKYQGIQSAYQAAMSSNNASTSAILQALNNLASSIKTTK